MLEEPDATLHCCFTIVIWYYLFGRHQDIYIWNWELNWILKQHEAYGQIIDIYLGKVLKISVSEPNLAIVNLWQFSLHQTNTLISAHPIIKYEICFRKKYSWVYMSHMCWAQGLDWVLSRFLWISRFSQNVSTVSTRFAKSN